MNPFLPIWETDLWKIVLHEDQRYLGRAIASAKNRDRPNLSTLTNEEWLDLSENVIKPFEAAVRSAFGAELFNWSCLMNLAYQNSPPDPHVHWHVKPRYRNPVQFAGQTFTDEAFGEHYLFGDPRNAREDVLRSIIQEINKHRRS